MTSIYQVCAILLGVPSIGLALFALAYRKPRRAEWRYDRVTSRMINGRK